MACTQERYKTQKTSVLVPILPLTSFPCSSPRDISGDRVSFLILGALMVPVRQLLDKVLVHWIDQVDPH